MATANRLTLARNRVLLSCHTESYSLPEMPPISQMLNSTDRIRGPPESRDIDQQFNPHAGGKEMPVSEVMDLSAEDVTEADWDELVHDMIGDSAQLQVAFSSGCSYCSSNCICATSLF